MMKTTMTTLMALLLAAPGLWAQGGGMHGHHGQDSNDERSGQRAMMGQGMMEGMGQGMGMMSMGGPGPAMILRMDEALDLSDDQRSRLEALQEEVASTHRQEMHAAMSARREAARALDGDSPDFAAYEEALSRAASRMVQAHVAMARVSVQAREILSEEQREELQHGMQMMRGMMGEQGGMGHDGMEHRQRHR